jgi:hypothetical protein
MMTLRITSLTRKRLRIEELSSDGTATKTNEIRAKDIGTFATLGCYDAATLVGITTVLKEGESKTVEIVQKEEKQLILRVRPMREPQANAKEFKTWQEILTASLDMIDPVIEWDDRAQMAALDVDFHEYDMDNRPTQERLNYVISCINPRPILYWLTRGRGYRLIYCASDGFTADEFAAVASIGIREIDQGCIIEIKRSTRYPPGNVSSSSATADVTALQRWFTETTYDPSELQRWLNEHGYVIGERYEHDKCPGNPDNRIARRPVSVYPDHIYCHLCSRYFSFASLVGKRNLSNLHKAVKRFVHWQHAQYLIEEYTGLTGEIAKLAYSAALKLVHSTDIRIPSVFYAGQDLLRMPSHWITPNGESLRDSSLGPTISTLPACQNVEGKAIPSLVNLFTQPIDLTKYGYVPIMPIWGIRLAPKPEDSHDPYINVVMQNPCFNQGVDKRPKYLPSARRRFDGNMAFRLLGDIFPGLCANVVKLYIAAKGIADSEFGIPSMVIVSGPTSSAKTTTVNVAAAICGDTVHPVRGLKDEMRLRDAISAGKNKGGFVMFDEIIKDARKDESSIVESLSFALNLTPNSLSHKLYTGAVPLGKIPVLIFVDTYVPTEVTKDAQLSRRLIHVHMSSRVEWNDSIQAARIGKIEYLRLHSEEIAHACNVIISEVIDECFGEPQSFLNIAKYYGFNSLENSEFAEQSREELVAFYQTVCAAPGIEAENDKKRWRGPGWKLIDRDKQNELVEAWEMMCDGMKKDQYINSRKCTEIDWQKILDADTPIVVEIYPHGMHRLAIRFRSGRLYNHEIVTHIRSTDPLQLGASANGVHRPRDTSDKESEKGWIKNLPDGSIH